MNKELLNLITKFELKLIPLSDIVSWATDLVVDGVDSESVVLLAGTSNGDISDVPDLFKASVEELGFIWPQEKEVDFEYVKILSESILNGSLDPSEEVSKISEINVKYDWPKELSDFGYLAHVQSDHEPLGFTKESVRPEIIKAADSYIKNYEG